MTKSARTDSATAYAREVVDGKVVVGRFVRLACARHLRDLEEGPKRGLVWRIEKAEHAIEFFPRFLRLAEGSFAGRPFELESFQRFIVGSLFGWYNADGTRRFRTGYVEIGKGNGKSPLAAGLGLYGLVADGEPAAQIYSGAVDKDQARIVFGDAVKMVKASPALRKRVTVSGGRTDENKTSNLGVLKTGSFFRPLSRETKSKDGFRPHMILIDELHEHQSPVLVNKLKAGSKGRRRFLAFEITNSGFDRHSVCWDHHLQSVRLLEGELENDSWFAYVCSLDPCGACARDGQIQPKDGCADCDDWRDEKVWKKANPGLGTMLPVHYLRQQVKDATDIPAQENIVKRLNFCLWTEQMTRWLALSAWDECAGDVEEPKLAGRPCFAALDLSATDDLTARILAFAPDGDDVVDLLAMFWLPEGVVADKTRRDHVPYDVWIRQGLIRTTPGNAVDYDFVREDILEQSSKYGLQVIGLDSWNARQITTDLQNEGLEIVEIRQGAPSLSAPSKELNRRILSKKIRHGGNPVLRWMAGNVAIQSDANGNIRPVKDKSNGKIDGIVAAIMAIDLVTRNLDVGDLEDGRGLLVIGG